LFCALDVDFGFGFRPFLGDDHRRSVWTLVKYSSVFTVAGGERRLQLFRPFAECVKYFAVA
jgi:hypothetical protein